MSLLDEIRADTFRNGLLTGAERVCAARDELGELDAAAGDGDLGTTLATGFAHVREVVEGYRDRDVGGMLVQVGITLARQAPSTIGALLATAFMRAGRELEGISSISTANLVAMLDAAAAGVAERGKVGAGQRTVFDSMAAAAEAASTACAGDLDPFSALRDAAAGAQLGADATAAMEPQVGRAGWIRDRARGSPDAGAAAWAVFLSGLAEGCVKPVSGDQP